MSTAFDSGPTPAFAGEPQLDRLLVELLEVATAQRPAALRAMCASHPTMATALQRRLSMLQELSLLDDEGDESRFGRFELVRRLGGGMTDVYLARDPQAVAPVVVKVLRHAELREPAARRCLEHEAMAATRLQQPCINRVLEIGDVDGTPYLVEPYIEGVTLAEWIQGQAARRHRCDPEDLQLLCAWLEDVARALHAAHSIGLVHRDVKPANILIPWQGRPLLLDFGLAQEVEAAEGADAPTPACGTLGYMAPELLSARERPAGPAADIYALGATMYECIAQRLPFAGDTRQALCRAILVTVPPEPRRWARDLPPATSRVVAAAMARQAWERYSTAAAFADDLARLRRGEPVEAPRTSAWRSLRRWARHNRPTAVLAGIATLLSVALALATGVAAAARSWRDDAAAEVDLLAIPQRVRAATARAHDLVPGWPHQVDALAAWLADEGEPLLALLPALRLRAQGLATDRAADPTLATTVQGALAELEAFAAPHGLLARMRERLLWARTVRGATIESYAAAWRETRAAIAADPRYGGLDLPPQLGLVPLGKDLRSGLFEFYDPRTAWPGPPVTRHPSSQELVLHDGAGLVFVLVPGGRCTIGQQATDPAGARYDPAAPEFARPHEVVLDAFFLSKYEMTQGQWWQLTGQLPSYFVVSFRYADDPPIGYRHPVEFVSALECDQVLEEVGLVLPTEAQWEYACGTGVPTRWSWGDDPRELPRHANLLDRRQLAVQPGVVPAVDADDGFAYPAEVGRYEPNPFGLFDMLGNVAEWCRDRWVAYDEVPARAGDGLRLGNPRFARHQVFRGGSYTDAGLATSSLRDNDLPERRSAYIGLRPARAVRK